MSRTFLGALMEGLHFPAAMYGSLVKYYTPRFASELAENQFLGAHARSLVTPNIKALTALNLVMHGSTHGVDALLATQYNESDVLINLLHDWQLSPADQLRLVDRDLTPEVLGYAETCVGYFTPDAIRAFHERHGVRPSDLHAVLDEGLPKQSRILGAWHHPGPRVPPKYEGRVLDATLGELTKERDTEFLSDTLWQYLGTATTAESLEAWQTFLTLSASDIDVPLRGVLDVAACLNTLQ